MAYDPGRGRKSYTYVEIGPMEFEINKEIIAEIIFGMENQAGTMAFDTETGTIVSNKDGIPGAYSQAASLEESRYLPLPVWRPVEGFQLMERFTGSLHNPVVQKELREALASGTGVFKNFKQAVKSRPDIARLWYAFKDKEMKQVVLDWYDDLCNTWGWIQRAGELSDYLEDTEELVREDFVVEDISRRPDLILCLEKKIRKPETSDKIAVRREGLVRSLGVIALRMAAPDGTDAGLIWGAPPQGGKAAIAIRRLYVFKEFRGLGLAKELLKTFCAKAAADGGKSVRIILSKRALYLEHSLADLGFSVNRMEMVKLAVRPSETG